MSNNKALDRVEIVAALRCCGNTDTKRPDCGHCPAMGPMCVKRMLEGATDMLEQFKKLEAERAEKDKRLEAKEAIIRLHEPTVGIMSAQRDEAIHRMRDAETALSRVEAERDAAVALINKLHEMLRPGEAGQGYGYAVTNAVAYMVYARINDWRGEQGVE